MTAKTYRVGLLGAGYILDAHAKAVRAVPNATLHAVCDVSRSKAEAAAATYRIPNVHHSIEQLCASDVDAVHVLLPANLHMVAARQLVEAGKHVLLEKPMGTNSTECQAVVDLGKQRGVKVGVSHNFLFGRAYEDVRRRLHDGEFGPLDHVHVNWLAALGLIQFGPYNNWILAQPQNILLELGSHLSAFVVDLAGGVPDVLHAEAGDPIDLPGDLRVYRHWIATLRSGRTAIQFALSANPGYGQRTVMIRGLGGMANVEFGRDLYTAAVVNSTNPVFDNRALAKSIGRSMLQQGEANFIRSMKGALRKDATANEFLDGVRRAAVAFHADTPTLDSRVDGQFGTNVIRLCEEIARKAGIDPWAPPPTKAVVAAPKAATRSPDVLVVGGTGFIGKRLIQKLIEKGHGVRVLTRARSSAEVELGPLGVDIVQGSHGDRAVLDKILPQTKVVIHLAKAAGTKWQDYVDQDVKPTQVLAQAALEHKVQRFIYTGTIDSYFSARAGDVITGDTPLDPLIHKRNLYARSKAACEAMLQAMHKQHGLPLVIFRPGIVIGAGSPPAHWGVGMFHADARVDLWGSDDHPLPFVLVDDVADAIERGVTAPGIEGQAFLLTDAPVLSGNDYVRELEKLAGVKINVRRIPAWKHFGEDLVKEAVKNAIRHPNRRIPSLRDWDCRSHRARYDSTKTQQVLGWKPAGTRERIIAEGIGAAVEFYYR